MALDDDMQTFRADDSKQSIIRRMIDSGVTDLVWQYVCSRKTSCPAATCAECVMEWLRKKEAEP